ncbi:MAG: NlpC/P60 family protein [Hyphomicrobiaceae bacterium]|nr:NlpC/P60 family protein [Hyphomicrobiaceae bacterium]
MTSSVANRRVRPADIVCAVRGWIGTPYHAQASLRGVGTDCLGLVRGVWREVYGSEPELPPAYTSDWTAGGRGETLLDAARRHFIVRAPAEVCRPGDVIVFRCRAGRPAHHCGIATDPARFVHAIERHAVREDVLGVWWRRRITGVFSFPGVHD